MDALCQRLLSTFDAIPYAGGLSAIQLGIPLRVTIVNLKREQGGEVFLINPTIISASEAFVPRTEGCLSLPGYKATIQRHKKVKIRALNRSGNEFVYTATGYESAIVQHELDHMDGKLYWDRLPPNGTPLSIALAVNAPKT
jgi:peptide deformylase